MKFILNKKNLKRLYILNDHKSIDQLKIEFNSDKFAHIPDPIELTEINISKKNSEKNDTIVLLFLGVITSSKGILEVLNAINSIPSKIKYSLEIRIIGRTSENFREMFHKEIRILKE